MTQQIQVETGCYGQPIASFTNAASWQTFVFDNARCPCSGSRRLPRRTTAILSACAAQSIRRPVSPARSSMWAGPSLWIDVDSGITKTVVARSCRFRASGDTTITGRLPFSGGSVWKFVHQISPLCGYRSSTYRTPSRSCVSANRPHSLSSADSSLVIES